MSAASSAGRRHGAFASSAARGAGLVGAAVILGIILLQVIDNGPSGSDGTVVPSVSTTTATSTDGTTSTTGAAAGDAHPRDQVRVVVLNGSNQDNVATLKTNNLRALGYQMDPANNTQLRQGSIVACKEGFEADANQLATDVGGTIEVEPFPNPPPTGRDGGDVGAANVNCVVILGEA